MHTKRIPAKLIKYMKERGRKVKQNLNLAKFGKTVEKFNLVRTNHKGNEIKRWRGARVSEIKGKPSTYIENCSIQ